MTTEQGRWEIAGDIWTAEEIRLAADMARERASIKSLSGADSQVQLTWLTWARGILAHREVVRTSIPCAMPPRRDIVAEAGPDPILFEVTGPRLATKDEIPRSANTLWNNALKAGWWCYLTYYRGPWLEVDGDRKIVTVLQAGLDVEVVPAYGMTEVIILRGKRKGKKFQASWVLKPWLKDPKYKYEAGHFWPDGDGLVPSPLLTKMVKGIHEIEEATL